MAPTNRSWGSFAAEQAFGWRNGLSKESCSYTYELVHIPVGDGVEIAAYLFSPVGVKPAGTILARSLYGFVGFGGFVMLIQAKLFASRGYQVLWTSCRGSFESGGTFHPGHNEAADGKAVLSWMRAQPWYTGSFATIGSSYLGYVQWALLSDPPPDMKAAAIYTGLHNIGKEAWGTGALRSDMIAWAEMIPQSGAMSVLGILFFLGAQQKRLRPVYDSVPLLDAVDKHLGKETPDWIRKFVTIPDRSDPVWEAAQHNDALEKANIPIFLTSGWYDIFAESVFEQYAKLAARGCDVSLTIGPWPHMGGSDPTIVQDTFAMFGEHLADQPRKSPREPPVRVFVTGAKEWRRFPAWPPATISDEFCLWPGKKLSTELPPADATDSAYVFNPADPTPSIGMPALMDFALDTEDTALASRSDVATFATEPLEQDLEIFGRPSVVLCHSTDNPHADLLVRLSEINRAGKSHTVTEEYRRLDPARGSDPLHMLLNNCAHRFTKGNRIRLVLAGGSHPRFIRNLGTGENPGTGTEMRSARHSIAHNASSVSKLILPVSVPHSL